MNALVATEAKSNRVVLGSIGGLAAPNGSGQNRSDFLCPLRGRQAGGVGKRLHEGDLLKRWNIVPVSPKRSVEVSQPSAMKSNG